MSQAQECPSCHQWLFGYDIVDGQVLFTVPGSMYEATDNGDGTWKIKCLQMIGEDICGTEFIIPEV